MKDYEFLIGNQFTNYINKQIYGREISNKLSLPNKSIANHLNELENKFIIKSKIIGKQKYFNLNFENSTTKDWLSIIEIKKKINFLNKHIIINEFYNKIEKEVNGIIIVFGSYAKGIEKENSDLDLLIIGKTDIKNIEKVAQIYNIEANIKQIYPDKLENTIKEKDNLFLEILKNHIILKNCEEFTSMIFQYEKWI